MRSSGGRGKSGTTVRKQKNETDLKILRCPSVGLASPALPHLLACQKPALQVDQKADKVPCPDLGLSPVSFGALGQVLLSPWASAPRARGHMMEHSLRTSHLPIPRAPPQLLQAGANPSKSQKETCVRTSPGPLTSCVTLVKLPELSELPFGHSYCGIGIPASKRCCGH